jgi:hypothetical protein
MVLAVVTSYKRILATIEAVERPEALVARAGCAWGFSAGWATVE